MINSITAEVWHTRLPFTRISRGIRGKSRHPYKVQLYRELMRYCIELSVLVKDKVTANVILAGLSSTDFISHSCAFGILI